MVLLFHLKQSTFNLAPAQIELTPKLKRDNRSSRILNSKTKVVEKDRIDPQFYICSLCVTQTLALRSKPTLNVNQKDGIYTPDTRIAASHPSEAEEAAGCDGEPAETAHELESLWFRLQRREGAHLVAAGVNSTPRQTPRCLCGGRGSSAADLHARDHVFRRLGRRRRSSHCSQLGEKTPRAETRTTQVGRPRCFCGADSWVEVVAAAPVGHYSGYLSVYKTTSRIENVSHSIWVHLTPHAEPQ